MKAGLGWIRCIAKINLDLFCQTAFNHTSTAIIPSTHIHTDLHIYTYTYIFYPLALQVLWVVTISLLELLLEWRYFVGKARSRKDDTADPQHALSILTTEKPSSIAHQAVCQSENWVYRPVKWVHLEKDGIDKEQYDSQSLEIFQMLHADWQSSFVFQALLEGKIYSQTDIISDRSFKGLSMVATVLDHHSNKIC